MAYRGMAGITAAKKSTDGKYIDGFRCKNAMKFTIEPVYEDVSDYNDINDTEEEEIFAYADITLNKASLSAEEENKILGRNASNIEILSAEGDRSAAIGFGFYARSGTKYAAIWIHQIVFKEGGGEHNTRNDGVSYDTETLSGKAVPNEEGNWRTKRFFDTKKEAASWLDEMAGIEEDGGKETWLM